MADQLPYTQTINIGAAGTEVRTLMHVPADFGGITILGAWLVAGAAATVVSNLVNCGTALGTAVSSVIGTLTDGTLVANVRKPMSITTAYQAKDTWIGFQSVTGITATVTELILEYKYGK